MSDAPEHSDQSGRAEAMSPLSDSLKRGWWPPRRVAVIGAGAALIAVIVIVVLVVASGGSKGGVKVEPGSIVGAAPITQGFRVEGKVRKAGIVLTVRITRLQAAGPDARNVVLRPGADIVFEPPADGPTALARNGHAVDSAAKLHNNDHVVIVGEWTAVAEADHPRHDGYAYIGVEADTKA